VSCDVPKLILASFGILNWRPIAFVWRFGFLRLIYAENVNASASRRFPSRLQSWGRQHREKLVTCINKHNWKVKCKVVPLRSIEAHLGDRRYSSYCFLTSALEGGERSASCPGRALPPDKEPPVPTVQEAGWAPEPVWTQRLEEKILCLCRGSNPDRPVRSQTLYRLSYRAHVNVTKTQK
jgi:hypothetical protein